MMLCIPCANEIIVLPDVIEVMMCACGVCKREMICTEVECGTA